MTAPDPAALHAEVERLLNDLRDKALGSTAGPWSSFFGRVRLPDGPDLLLTTTSGGYGDAVHVAAWDPAAVLLLVGDDGLLRRQAKADAWLAQADRWFRQSSVNSLTALRDTLLAMRDAR